MLINLTRHIQDVAARNRWFDVVECDKIIVAASSPIMVDVPALNFLEVQSHLKKCWQPKLPKGVCCARLNFNFAITMITFLQAIHYEVIF